MQRELATGLGTVSGKAMGAGAVTAIATRRAGALATLLLATAVGAGCGGAKAPVHDDFSALAGLEIDGKADSFSSRMKIEPQNSLAFGQTSLPIAYSETPRYRAVPFYASPGDHLSVWVRSPTGDAVTWVVDSRMNVIAFNDDADDSTVDSHVVTRLPASTKPSRVYYVILRDYDLAPGSFTVTVSETTVSPGFVAHAEAAYVSAFVGHDEPGGAAAAVPQLPATARAQVADYVQRFSALHAMPVTRRLTVDGKPVFVIALDVEERYFVDLYDGAGHHLAHGYDGDSGPEISTWSPVSYDPSLM